MPAGKANIEVTFELTNDGILKVTAKETSTGNAKDLTIKTDAAMDPEEKKEMTKRAAGMRNEMINRENKLIAKNACENLVFAIQGCKSNSALSQAEQNSLA